MHRDIKLQNIFLKKQEGGKIIYKLGDFGVAKYFEDHDKPYQNTFIGTFNYMAPEIIKNDNYNYKCDLYSLGAVLYFLVFKKFPYQVQTSSQLLKNFENGTKFFLKSPLQILDELLKSLLEMSPDKRISGEDYLNHKFFREDKELLKNICNEKNQSYNKKEIIENIKKKDNLNNKNIDKKNQINICDDKKEENIKKK